MTGSGTPKFEIPADMRNMTEQSLEQVKTAINAYLQFFKSNVPDNVMGGSALSDKILSYAERNVASAFEFAQRLTQSEERAGYLHAADGIHAGADAGHGRANERLGRDYD